MAIVRQKSWFLIFGMIGALALGFVVWGVDQGLFKEWSNRLLHWLDRSMASDQSVPAFIEPDLKEVSVGYHTITNADVIALTSVRGKIRQTDFFLLSPDRRWIMLHFQDAVYDDGIQHLEKDVVQEMVIMSDYRPLDLSLIDPSFQEKLVDSVRERFPDLERFRESMGARPRKQPKKELPPEQ